jgi:selenobiotic family peptide radical SAM maturase
LERGVSSKQRSTDLRAAFPATLAVLPRDCLEELEENPPEEERFVQHVERLAGERVPFAPDLARLERAVLDCGRFDGLVDSRPEGRRLNPSIQLLKLEWKDLPAVLQAGNKGDSPSPVQGEEELLVWREPQSGLVRAAKATREDYLALKIVAENISVEEVASEHGLPPVAIYRLLQEKQRTGLLLGPRTAISRDSIRMPRRDPWAAAYREAEIFTLQWHVTQACDLHCRHCYDRSDRSRLSLERGLSVIEELKRFCLERNVQGQISFTGGNPLLHPHFEELYQAASDAGFLVAILGNPADRAVLERLKAIQTPAFYQVSLEGLEAHNDLIRQPGHFQRVLGFLSLLRKMGIASQVMLTLTEANLEEVLPLAEALRGRADRFTFNRLSLVGEGAALRLPSPQAYRRFMERYLEAERENPSMGLKDNLLNALLYEAGQPMFGGCTGFGCGAAFNFVSLLPDGEVHACRKLPSYLGNMFQSTLSALYDSPRARAYRNGPEACRDCHVLPVCGGCLAVSYSLGLEETRDKDPFCPLG